MQGVSIRAACIGWLDVLRRKMPARALSQWNKRWSWILCRCIPRVFRRTSAVRRTRAINWPRTPNWYRCSHAKSLSWRRFSCERTFLQSRGQTLCLSRLRARTRDESDQNSVCPLFRGFQDWWIGSVCCVFLHWRFIRSLLHKLWSLSTRSFCKKGDCCHRSKQRSCSNSGAIQ